MVRLRAFSAATICIPPLSLPPDALVCIGRSARHAHRDATDRYFLKEISSDGDLSTVDVIFPASPILLMLRPELLVMQSIPLLAYVV